MDKRPPILYCHCAHADVIPADTRERILEALAQSGAAYEAVADLCELAARRDPLLKKFAEGGPVRIIACWPRTVRWLFAYAGATLPAGAVIHNMRKELPEALVPYLAPGEHTRGRKAGDRKPRLGKPAVPQFDAKKPGEWVPWFPVIDYDRCQDCRQCFQFCLFGVYAADEGGKVRVAKPENCKTGCPACARICPQAAIIFPKYVEGAISGDDAPPAADEGRPEKPIDFSSLAGLDIHEAIRRRSAILRARQEREQAKPQDMPVPKACPRKGGVGMPPGQDVPAKKHGHASREGGKRE